MKTMMDRLLRQQPLAEQQKELIIDRLYYELAHLYIPLDPQHYTHARDLLDKVRLPISR